MQLLRSRDFKRKVPRSKNFERKYYIYIYIYRSLESWVKLVSALVSESTKTFETFIHQINIRCAANTVSFLF